MKKELKLRIPALILATLMLISVLVSCAEQISDDTEPEGTEAVLPDTDPAEETTEAAVNALNILGKRDLNNTKTPYTQTITATAHGQATCSTPKMTEIFSVPPFSPATARLPSNTMFR